MLLDMMHTQGQNILAYPCILIWDLCFRDETSCQINSYKAGHVNENYITKYNIPSFQQHHATNKNLLNRNTLILTFCNFAYIILSYF